MHEEEPEVGDGELISRVRAGDTDAYGMLCARHLPAARGLARHLVAGDAAEDAVQEAFAKILDLLRRGGGPDSGFRPYLLTTVRRAVYDAHRAERRVRPTDRIGDLDHGTPFEDPALHELERSMAIGAFQALPERWQTVLWHTEIEGARPADVAPLLGLTANGAAALAYRAREGLRQAYLQMHLAALPAGRGPCREAVGKLGAYVRDGLARRDTRRVRGHLDGCADCKAVHAELAELNGALREVLGPLVLGAATTAYLATGSGLLAWLGRLPRRGKQALGGAAVVVCAVAQARALARGRGPAPPRPWPRAPGSEPLDEPEPAPPAAVLPTDPSAPIPPADPPPAAPVPVDPPPAERAPAEPSPAEPSPAEPSPAEPAAPPAPSRPAPPVPAVVVEPVAESPKKAEKPEPPRAEKPEPETRPEPPTIDVDHEFGVQTRGVRAAVRTDVRIDAPPTHAEFDIHLDIDVDVEVDFGGRANVRHVLREGRGRPN